MKVILVINQNDYDALKFENNFMVDLKTWQKIKAGEILTCQEDGDDEEYEFCCKAFEFDKVAPAFVKFIQQYIQDEDHAKHTNFYIVKESE